MCLKVSYAPLILCANPLIRDFTISCHLFLHLLFFSKPAISTLERVDALIFFTKCLPSRRRCAQSPSDLFFPALRLYSGSLRAHQVDSERRHLLPTQHAQQGHGGCARTELLTLQGEGRREGRSAFASAISSDETGRQLSWLFHTFFIFYPIDTINSEICLASYIFWE